MAASQAYRAFYGMTAVLVLTSLATVALGDYHPVLHERFELAAEEDLAFGVRVTSAGLPAALQTREGVQALPEPRLLPRANEPSYGEGYSSVVSPLRMDGATSDPGALSYHEPFRPSVAPFKRTHVYDAVSDRFDLVLSDARLRPVSMVASPESSQDQFFADLVVDARGEQPVRIASPGPQMTIFGAHLEPESPFGFYVDRAENWYVRVPQSRGKVRLVMHVGVERSAFDGRIEAASYSVLAPQLPSVPANVRQAVSDLLVQIGVSRVLAPADAVERLVAYFRGFAESKEHLSAPYGEALYRELVKTQKGVCRHRAYAFVVTALGMGIPARFVHNEAHAWIEVYGGSLWHRIDLGGAASGFSYRGEPPLGNPHQAPGDAYRWPSRSRRSDAALPPPRTERAPGAASSGSTDSGAAVTYQELPARPSGRVPAVASLPEQPGEATGRIDVTLSDGGRVLRGQSLEVSGTIVASGAQCDHVKVKIALMAQSGTHATAVAVTEAQGHFSARLSVPADVPVGDYELSVTSEPTEQCPRASLR